jgi:ribosomal protein S18 acetylase RimI-like enzyme
MNLVDLRKHPGLINDYVELRNKYVYELMSSPITLESTEKWMLDHKALMMGVIESQELIGACIVYPERNNELTIFVKYPHRGIGKFIIDNMGNLCREYNITEVWARVRPDNHSARKFFEKEFETIYRRKL